MSMWEFDIAASDGYELGHTLLVEAASEAEADVAATAFLRSDLLPDHPNCALTRPCRAVPGENAARWRELFGERFPTLAPLRGRLGLWARGSAEG